MEIQDGQSGITRKTFLRGIGGVSLLGIAAGFGAPLASEAKAETAELEPVHGGVLTFNLAGAPPNFDPLSNTSSGILNVIGPCYNGLIRSDPDDPDAIIADLALTWDTSEDGKVVTFNLVRNAKFHDGKPMTSADVKTSFDFVRDPPQGTSSSRKLLLSMVQSIEAVDDHTVRFNLKYPSPAFVPTLASGWMLVMPKHVLDAKGSMKEDIIGTGPFKLKEHVPGVSIELERNVDYHVPNRPFLDGAKGYIVPDAATTASYLKSGQLDWFVSMRGQDAGTMKSDNEIQILDGPSTTFMHIVFNSRIAPFDNIDVRRAASLAIDRKAAIAIVSNGYGSLGGSTLGGPWALPETELDRIPGYGSNTSANIEEAKKLMAGAGHGSGIKVTLLVRNNPLFEPLAVFVKDQWAKIGIEATLNIQENASFIEMLSSGQFNACPNGGAPATSDPNSIYGNYYACQGAQNTSGVCDSRIDELFQEQSTTLDSEKRLALVRQLEIETLKQYSFYVVFWTRRFMGLSRRVHGLKLHPNIDQNMRLESVWLSS